MPTIKSTLQASGAARPVLILAILVIGTGVRAIDWTTVPVGTFVAEAIAVVDAVPADEPETLATELAAMLNAAVVRKGLTDEVLQRVIGAAYDNPGAEPVALVKGVYPLIKPEGRNRIAAALAAAAPADRKQGIVEAIRRLDLPAVPPLNRVVTRTSAIPWGKE